MGMPNTQKYANSAAAKLHDLSLTEIEATSLGVALVLAIVQSFRDLKIHDDGKYYDAFIAGAPSEEKRVAIEKLIKTLDGLDNHQVQALGHFIGGQLFMVQQADGLEIFEEEIN